MTTSPLPSPWILAESTLMENYRLGAPVSGRGGFATFRNRLGQLEVVGIGTDGNLYHLYRDPTSDTGWNFYAFGTMASAGPTVTPGFQAQSVAAGDDGNGNAAVFAIEAGSSNGYSSIISATDSGNAFRFQALQVTTVAPVKKVAVGYSASIGTVNPFFAIDLNGRVLAQNWESGWVDIDPDAPTAADFQCITGLGSIGTAAAGPNSGQIINPELFLFVERQTAVCQVYTCGSSGPSAPFTNLNPSTPFTIASGIQTPVLAFAADGSTPLLFSYRQTDATFVTGNLSELLQAGSAGDVVWTACGSPASANQVALGVTPITAANGTMELFYLTPMGSEVALYAMHQLQPGVSTGTTDAVPLTTGIVQFRASGAIPFTVGDPTNLSTVDTLQPSAFALDSKNRLWELYQESDTTDWTAQLVQVGMAGNGTFSTPETLSTYTTSITAVDAAGQPQPLLPVTVWSNSPADVLLNGVACTLSPDTPTVVNANASAQLTIMYVTDALAAPVYKVSHPLMPANTEVEVALNVDVQNRLEAVTGTDLLNAQTAGGQYLLASPYRDVSTCDSVAQGVNLCMSLTRMPIDGPPSASGALSAPRPSRLQVPAGSGFRLGQIHPGAVAPQYWEMDFSTGKPAFRALTAQEAAELFERNRNSYPALAAAAETSVSAWWGDIWSAIKNGVASLIRLAVQTIVDAATGLVTGIQASLTLMVNGVTYLFEQLVTIVGQAFDLVECIFDRVAVAFDQLFEWLGFLFAWDDILRTQKAAIYMAGQAFLALQNAVSWAQGEINTRIDGAFATIKNQLQQARQSRLAQNNLRQLLVGESQALGSNEPAFATSATHNIVANGFADNADAAIQTGPDISSASQAAINGAVSQIGALAGGWQSSSPFENVLAFFQSLVQTPDAVMTTPLYEYITAAENLIEAAKNGVKAVVDALAGALQGLISSLQDMLNAPLYVPLVSELYSYVSGGSALTQMRLFTLIAAVPATVGYKLVTRTAPFPTDAALSAFEAAITPQSIFPITSATSGLTAQEGPERLVYNPAAPISNWLYFGATIGFALCTAATDVTVFRQFKYQQKGSMLLAASGVIAFGVLRWLTSIPPFVMPVQVFNAYPNAFLGLWLSKLIGPLVQFIYLTANGVAARAIGETAPFVISVIGAIEVAVILLAYAALTKGEDIPGIVRDSTFAGMNMFRFLLLTPIVSATEGASVLILAGTDVALGAASAGAGAVVAYNVTASVMAQSG